MGFDERRLLLDEMDLRDILALACTCRLANVLLSPRLIDLFEEDERRYSWADRPTTLPAAWHDGFAVSMEMPSEDTSLHWLCEIHEHAPSQASNQWVAFGLETVDDSGWHMYLVSDRGCTYVDGKLQPQKTPALNAGDRLLFTLDLFGSQTESNHFRKSTLRR